MSMNRMGENKPDKEEQVRHGGDIYGSHRVRLDFSANTNPFGMPEGVLQAVAAHREDWEQYPDPRCRRLRSALADFYNQFLSREQSFKPDHFICGNGASDLLYSLMFALRPKKALLFSPCFGEYEAALRAMDCEVVRCDLKDKKTFQIPIGGLLKEEEIWAGVDCLILGNPNNPTGRALTSKQMEALAAFCFQRGIFLLVDECFQWFLSRPEEYSSLGLLKRYHNVFLLNAFTKIFSMAGLRLGYGICESEAVLSRVRAVRQPWSVSGPAARAGEAALLETDYLAKSRAYVEKEREFLVGELLRLGYEAVPSQVNYILVHSPFLGDLAGYCLRQGILIRSCSDFPGLSRSYFRVAVKKREENAALLETLMSYAKDNERIGEWQRQL